MSYIRYRIITICAVSVAMKYQYLVTEASHIYMFVEARRGRTAFLKKKPKNFSAIRHAKNIFFSNAMTGEPHIFSHNDQYCSMQIAMYSHVLSM